MRIENISQFLGGADNVKALELIRGEQINYRGTINSTGDNPQPIDISNFVLSAVAEFYTADVTVSGSGARAELTVEDFTPHTKADVTIPLTADADQTANTGQVLLTLPLDLADDADTADLNETEQVFVAVIFLTYNDGATPATIRKSRMLAVLRHSA